MKLKHRETLDIICGAVIGPITQPSEVVAGLVLDGKLRIVGRSTPLKTRESRELARWLQTPVGEHPWPIVVKGTALDRFNRDKEPVVLTLVEPLVVEVSADTAWSGRSFRHPYGCSGPGRSYPPLMLYCRTGFTPVSDPCGSL
ncbi:hypothetical protein QFZ57_004105 [Arthrobacter sp. B1I2]|nr:hypothetical protein [Arthrobacter sp. B1I2]